MNRATNLDSFFSHRFRAITRPLIAGDWHGQLKVALGLADVVAARFGLRSEADSTHIGWGAEKSDCTDVAAGGWGGFSDKFGGPGGGGGGAGGDAAAGGVSHRQV